MSARINLIWSCRWASNTSPPPRAQQIPAAHAARSGAVSKLINFCFWPSDVDSMNYRRTRPTPTTHGCRTSTMATRTTTTSRTVTGFAQYADQTNAAHHHADFSFQELVHAYFDCRKHKRNKASALNFECNLERNLVQLFNELKQGSYTPGKAICFVVTHPKPREVWAADFRDRIVHHLLYNRVAPQFLNSFIADSCACIPGRGTLYAARRLEAKIRSVTQNWSKPAHYLKCDLSNFFVSIDKHILHRLLAKKISEPWWLQLAELILFHDPRLNVEVRGQHELLKRVPSHKRLSNQSADKGLPIGNLSSQFFANIYLNELDQFVKHRIRAKHYIRYMDDFVLMHESATWLNAALDDINLFLTTQLDAQLNPKKTILQPVDRGVDFVGHVIKPWCTTPRKKIVHTALSRLSAAKADKLPAIANSYLGLMRQVKGYHCQALLAKQALLHGFSVKSDLSKVFN